MPQERPNLENYMTVGKALEILNYIESGTSQDFLAQFVKELEADLNYGTRPKLATPPTA